jgi:hypothetical protein
MLPNKEVKIQYKDENRERATVAVQTNINSGERTVPTERVLFSHFRVENSYYTLAEIVGVNYYARGIAICSNRDNFSRPKGRTIAFGRMMKAIALQSCISPMHPRKQVVENYAFQFLANNLLPKRTLFKGYYTEVE